MSYATTPGAELTKARHRAGLTQEQVAAALGVSRHTLIRWEGKAHVDAIRASEYLGAVRRLASQLAGELPENAA